MSPWAHALHCLRFALMHRRIVFASYALLVLGLRWSAPSAAHAEDSADRADRQPSWGFEIGLGSETLQHSPYIDRLQTFGFRDDSKYSGVKLHLGFDRRVLRYFALGLDYTQLETYTWTRDQESSGAKLVPGEFSWDTRALSAYARAGYPLLPHFYPFVHAGFGVAWASTQLDLEDAVTSEITDEGPMATIGVGFHLGSPYFGLALEYLHCFAQILDNELGDEHDSGGTYLLVSLRVQLLEGDL